MKINGLLLVFECAALLLALQLLYPLLSNMVAGLFGRVKPVPKPTPDPTVDFACIITAYRNAAITRPLVQSLLKQTHTRLHIYLVADACEAVDFPLPAACCQLPAAHLVADACEDQDFPISDRLSVFYPSPSLNLKIRSVRYAMDHLVRSHDYIAVFDGDNLAHPAFLSELSRFTGVYSCVQGQRTAKNTDTTYAALDALGEYYKNHLERQTPFLLGSSAVISGSGMAVKKGLYEAYLNSEGITKGQLQGKSMLQEDKILQNFLLRNGIRIAYAPAALVYDEKVETAQAVEVQRSRWLYSYFQNVPNALGLLLGGLVRLDWNRTYFGAVTLVLPMFVQVGLAGVFFLLGLWFAPWISVLMALGMVLFVANLAWSLRLAGAPPSVRAALGKTPLFVWRQVRALLRMRHPEKNFAPTEHHHVVSVDEVLNKKP
ncbi:MAG: glycosyltransferase [Saprospiraceae bacterium]|nr:glycosyltransferase [Saprospiraceae bacterium]